MCLAEALLAYRDSATADALIRDKLVPPNGSIIDRDNLLVDFAAWALVMTGKVGRPAVRRWSSRVSSARLIQRSGEPVIRKGVDLAMRTDGRAVRHRRDHRRGAWPTAASREARAYRYSYDMLGEAALTEDDAAAIPGRTTGRPSTRSARPRHGPRRLQKGRGSRSSCRPCTRATAAPERPCDGRAAPGSCKS